MTRHWFRSLSVALFMAALPAAAAQDGAPASRELADYAVLTPGLEGRFHVASGYDLTVLVNPFFSLGAVSEQGQSRALRALVEREDYDPAKPFADHLVAKLNDAEFTAVHQPIERDPPGRVQSLAWDELPESPKGKAYVEVTIMWLCLCSEMAFGRYYPAIGFQWRLLAPPREIVVPGRRITYFHDPYRLRRKKTARGEAPDPATLPPVAAVTEACGFQSVKAAESDPPQLWRCMDEAIAAAVDQLLFEMKKLRD